MILVREMTEADVPLGMHLKRQAGWGQTEADWRRFLALEPQGCFVVELEGEPAGTLTTCVFAGVGWIAMVLVEEKHRERGLGTALMRHALEYLDRRGVRTVRLDATPLGQPLYEKLGFEVDYGLTRYEGVCREGPPVTGVQAAAREHLEAIVALDRSVHGVDRGKALRRLWEEYPEEALVVAEEDLVGFLLGRAGEPAWFLGPCLARGEAGGRLLAAAAGRHAGQRVCLNIPDANAAARRAVEGLGLQAVRPFVRMHRGEPVGEEVEAVWATSGGEKG